MALFSAESKSNCTGIAIVSSIIIGIITAFLRITAVITVTPVFLWVVFGIAVAYLAVTLIAIATARQAGAFECIYSTLSALLIGILGTILFSIILLAIEFAATSVIGAIVTGLLLLFFFLTVTTTACLVRCFVNCNN